MTAQERPATFYAAEEKIYPREIKGDFQSLRNLAVVVLLGAYYLLPWINWQDHQAILFDLPARKFYIFSITFWPQDFYYLTWLLVIAAITLFFTTAVAGRLWCGYACPQTVWTEAFIWMERWTEGDRNKQIKLDNAPWNLEKIWRKSLKQSLWIIFSLWTGLTFVGYFTPITDMIDKFLVFDAGPWECFWIVFYSAATYGNAGFMREQVCKYMCPYARFQSAMFDKDTLIIAYNKNRGEPRGHRKKGVQPYEQALGDCIDCGKCVQVCPTGIDIRDGLQYECIACGACIDACDSVMKKIGYPKKLIRYTSENADFTRKFRIIRPRTLVYFLIWLGLIYSFIFTMSVRVPLDIDVIRDRNALYRRVNGQEIENVYTLKIMNKDNVDHYYSLSVEGISGIEIVQLEKEVAVAGGELLNLPIRIRVPLPQTTIKSTEIVINAVAKNNPKIYKRVKTRFFSPTRGSSK